MTDEQTYEEEVANHPLTKEAEALAAQEDELLKLGEERKKQYAEELENQGFEPEDFSDRGAEVPEEDDTSTVDAPKKVDTSKIKPAQGKSENDDAKTGGPSAS